ncbi:MAG: LVIVD repeat-containing protein [Candidatus Thorarchaeota archaeon]
MILTLIEISDMKRCVISVLIINTSFFGIFITEINQMWINTTETGCTLEHEGGEHDMTSSTVSKQINSKFSQDIKTQGWNGSKIRINEIKYETESKNPIDEKANDEYIELLVVEGGFDPSYWYITDWDDNNYWEIPDSCPVVATGELIVLNLGYGFNDNTGPVYHFYMNKLQQQLNNQGEPLTLFTDNDSTHNRSEDLAYDFVVYGTMSQIELIPVNTWCGWPNNGSIAIDSIELAVVNYESIQLVGDDLDNKSNWFSCKPTPGEINKLTHFFHDNFKNECYLNATATNASGWGIGRIQLNIGMADPPIIMGTTGEPTNVYISGNYAYLSISSWDDFRGLAIIDISDPTNPGTPIYQDTTGRAYDIFVRGNYAYIASEESGLAIIDISDPTNPGIPIYQDTTGEANGIFVSGDYAYVAVGSSGLAIIDISDPINPGTPLYQNTTGMAYDVFVRDSYAYVASDESGLAIINVSDPRDPQIPIYQDTTGHAYGIYISGDYAYIADNEGLAIINISDPTNPQSPIYRDAPRDAYALCVSGNFAYVGATDGGMLIVDISDPTTPGIPIQRDTLSYGYGTYVRDDYVYLAGGTSMKSGLVILEVAFLTSLSVVQSTSLYTSKWVVHNVTVNADQTVFPNTSISHQISYDGNTWISVNLNETYHMALNTHHELFWRAVMTIEDTQGSSPRLDSLKIDFDIYYDLDPPIITLLNYQNNTIIAPGVILEFNISDYLLDQCWFKWDQEKKYLFTEPWLIPAPTNEGYHNLIIQVNDSIGHETKRCFQFYVAYLTYTSNSSSQGYTRFPLLNIFQILGIFAVLFFVATLIIIIKKQQVK